jgi:hypothetical protein
LPKNKMDQWPDFQRTSRQEGKPIPGVRSLRRIVAMRRGHLEGPTKIKKWENGRFFRWFFGGFLYWLFFRFVEDSVKMVKSLGVNSVAKINHLLSIGHGNKNEGKHGFPCHFGTMS